MSTVSEQVRQASSLLRATAGSEFTPQIGLILGSGLGPYADTFEKLATVSYADVPHLGACTAKGHAGNFVLGGLHAKPVIAMQGRKHYYECIDMNRVVLGVRIMAALDVETIIVTNAAGGLNPEFEPGQFMVISDHLNEMATNPLLGSVCGDEIRFPPMTPAYDPELRQLAYEVGESEGISELLTSGVYAAVTGPTYETSAEAKKYRGFGADAIGMSTVPEVIVARAQQTPIRVLGISLITNMSGVEGNDHEEVVDMAEHRRPEFTKLLDGIIRRL